MLGVVLSGPHWAPEFPSTSTACVVIGGISHMYLVNMTVCKKETENQGTKHSKDEDTHRSEDSFGVGYCILFTLPSLAVGCPVIMNGVTIICRSTTTTTNCHLWGWRFSSLGYRGSG